MENKGFWYYSFNVNPNKDYRHCISCAQARVYIIPRPSEFLILQKLPRFYNSGRNTWILLKSFTSSHR
jgi:hypothetical protein